MRKRFTASGYSFGKTYYRNYYDSTIAENTGGASMLYTLKTHYRNAPSVNMYNQKSVAGTSGTRDDGTTYTTFPMIVDIGEAYPTTCAVDIVQQIHSKINKDEPSCKVSFICSLVTNSGLMTNEELQLLINYKTNVIRRTEEGKKLVKQYYTLGAVLEKKMQNDIVKHSVYREVYDRWLKDVLEAVKVNNKDKATELYLECVDWLCKKYKVPNGVKK